MRSCVSGSNNWQRPANILHLPRWHCCSGSTTQETALEVLAPESLCNWEFRIEPYGWLTGLEGTAGVIPLITGIDQSFSDIFGNLEMAAALQFEARNGCWGFPADGSDAELGSEWSPF